MLDENKLRIGFPVWLAGWNGLGNGVPFWFVGWGENKLRVSVPVRPAG